MKKLSELQDMQIHSLDDVKRGLSSLLNSVKARIEMEKGFGVDAFLATRQKKAVSPALNSSAKPILAETSVATASPGGQTPLNKERIQLLENLKNETVGCQKCSLSKTRTNLVFGVGNCMAELMFVGEAPGRDEDLQGEPFVGRAGQLLTKIIEAIGMKRTDVYIANVLKCRPPGNRSPLPDEIALCTSYLTKQIDIIKPKVLCALGTFASQTLLNTKAPVGTLRGRFHEYQGIPMMVTFHPAYLLRNPNDKAKVWEDMKKVRDFLAGTLPVATTTQPELLITESK